MIGPSPVQFLGGPTELVDVELVGQVEGPTEEEVGEDGHGRVGANHRARSRQRVEMMGMLIK